MLTPIFDGQALGIDSGSSRPALVLLHAFPLDPTMWQQQVVGLSGTARVLAPAAPGFGGSPFNPGEWTVDSLADQLAVWLEVAKLGQVVMGGLSMGGYVALAFARRHPDRLRGLILADTKSEPDSDEARANRDRMIALVRERGTATFLETMLPKLVSEHTRNSRPDVIEEVKCIGSRQPTEAIEAALRALRDRPDATPGLRSIRVPTLVIVGSEDGLTPPAVARTMSASIPDARCVEIPGAGHLSNLESADEFNAAVISFFTSL